MRGALAGLPIREPPGSSKQSPPISRVAMRTRVNATANQEHQRQKKKAPETTFRKPFS
jgi:hypothetical protein